MLYSSHIRKELLRMSDLPKIKIKEESLFMHILRVVCTEIHIIFIVILIIVALACIFVAVLVLPILCFESYPGISALVLSCIVIASFIFKEK